MMEKLADLMRFWPAFLAVIILGLGLAETRFKVEQLEANKEGERQQWVRLGQLGERLTKIESWQIGIDNVVTPEGIQEWGRIKADVARHERLIEQLQSR